MMSKAMETGREALTDATPVAADETRRRRRRGKGSLFKRGLVWWYAVSYRGRQIRESTGETDKKKAQLVLDAKLTEMAGAKAGHGTVVTPDVKAVTVKTLLDALLVDYKLRKRRSLPQVRAHLGYPAKEGHAATKILGAFGHWRAFDIVDADPAIDRYIDTRIADGASHATLNRETQLFKQALEKFFAKKLYKPLPDIRHFSEKGNARQGYFERAEFEAVVANLPDAVKDVARFGYLTGWRRGEVLSLVWADVDREGGEITLGAEHSKNGESRTLALAGDLLALMERRWQARVIKNPNGTTRVAEFVFHRNAARIVDFKKSWAAACTAAGVTGRLFHDLRRTAARNMVRAGVNEKVAMTVTGHKTRSMFDRYHITNKNDQREALTMTTAYLNGAPAERTVIPMTATPGTGGAVRKLETGHVHAQYVHNDAKGARR
jgi:integrase